MTERLIGETGSRKRRRFQLLPLVLIALAALFVIAGAQAVHDDGHFELDKNAADAAASSADDWDSVYQQILANPSSKCTALGAVECAFANDPKGTSIFTTGGSKDDLDVSSWRHTTGNVPPKDEISNAYAAKYSAGGSQIIYFGADRYAQSGSADFGFWFFHNPIAQVAGGTFSGAHQARTATQRGDILILGTFTQGGATSNIRVFEWVGTGGNATSNGTVAGPTGAFGDCVPGVAGDGGCGTVNSAIVPVAWPYDGKTGLANEIPIGGFVEGGIDLTALGLDGCFSSFMVETRSSPSVDATLKDFALGTFESCGSSTVTTPKLAGANIPATGTSITTAGSIQVTDSAEITVNGTSVFGGTVSFRICGPTPSADPYVLCSSSTGSAVGSPKSVSGPSPATVVSDPATITSAGRYCFSATYSGDASKGVPGSGDSALNECFQVNPVQPEISTTASAGPVALGTPIDDTATLSGTANDPDGSKADGSITFSLYGPDNATCAAPAIATRVVTLTNGGDGDYKASDGTGSGSLTPAAAGTYRWVASYSGDAPNTLGDSGACNDANESVVVSPAQPSILTQATAGPVPLGTALDDTATLSGTANDPDGSEADGTITFRLYGPDDATCATVIATRVVTLTNSGDGDYKASDGTGSGSLTPTSAGTYRWIASYSGDAPNTLSVSGACNDANEATVIISLQPTISTAQRFVPNDSATISVSSGGGDLAGTVRFRLYDNSTCAGAFLYDSGQINITSGTGSGLSRTVSSSNSTAYLESKSFSWLVEYTNTNLAHRNVTSACNKESSSITIDNDTTSP